MIGDKDLRIMRESNSTPWLTEHVWSAAARLGRREFVGETTTIEDDHLEFLEAGVPAVDIIDLDYPAWHRADDTLDKLSAASLQASGTSSSRRSGTSRRGAEAVESESRIEEVRIQNAVLERRLEPAPVKKSILGSEF